MRLLPRPERLRVQGDQRRDERPAVPDDHALADQGVAAKAVLEHRGRHVLAPGGDDHLLLPPGDLQEALLVQLPDVAGGEPAAPGEDLLGGCLVVPVAGEDVLPADQDLAVVGDLDPDAGQRLPDGADLVPVRPVHGGRGGRLGQPVSLEHGDADAAEEVAEPFAERRPAGDGVLRPAAERRPQLAVDQPVEHRVLGSQAERRTAGTIQRPAVRDRGVRGAAEDRALLLADRLLLGGVVHLLEHPRHGQDERRPERGQRGQQRGQVPAVPEHDPALEAAHLDDPGEHVRQRQEQQRARVLCPGHQGQRAEKGVPHVGQEVLVGQLAALGASGGARGVDDRGQVGRPGRGRPAGDDLITDVGARRAQRVEVLLDLPQVRQRGHPVPEAADGVPVGGGFDEAGPRARVGEDPFGLLGGGGLVDRHGDGARGPDGVVDQRPLVPGVRHQRDPVPGLDAGRDQSIGHRDDLAGELARGHVRPFTGNPGRPGRASKHHGLGLLGGPAEHDISEVRGRGDLC